MESLPGKTCGIVNKRSKIFSSQRPGPQVLYNLTDCCSACSSLRQLQELGCKGFAVLWDDIEPELTEEDAKHFTSFAEAHCKVLLPRPRLKIFWYCQTDQKSSFPQRQRQSPFHPKSGYSGDKQFARNSSTSKDASMSRRVLLVPRCPRSA